jgi:sirohydrochlorin cobaltochelatase
MPETSQPLAIVLIGHGSPATDCPPELIGELMSLEWRANGASHGPHHHGPPGAGPGTDALARRVTELDGTIRRWPRHAGNDPYKAGVEQLARVLQSVLPEAFVTVGYNEFCSPSIPEAVGQAIGAGASRVLVLSTMMTPGGVHSEQDIPRALAAVRQTHPTVRIDYLWPFNLDEVAALLAGHVSRALRVA